MTVERHADPSPPPLQTTVPLYLLDFSSALERRILESWIASVHGATTAAPVIVSLRDDDNADDEALTRALAHGIDRLCVPLRVLWQESKDNQTGHRGIARFLIGDALAPGWLLQHIIYRRDPARARPLVAEGATLSALRARLAEREPASTDAATLAVFIRHQALLALERAERNVRGARYKVPRMLEQEVLSKPRVRAALAQEAERSAVPMHKILQQARECLREMAPVHSTIALDLIAGLGRYLYTRGFDREIDVPATDVERIRKLGKRYPIAFLMTHKSHIDGFLLITFFYDLDMPPVHVFGGINMSFLGLGALGKRSGAIFIRRSMSGDNIYKAVFKQYIDYLAEKRFPLLWALEGTRSRTGKLMPPRYGLINYVVDSYVRAASTDMILMPVSIAYDQVPEVGDYMAEHKGVAKKPESASWFMQYISGLRNPFGKIHIRFGEGLKLSEVLGPPRPDLQISALDIQKIAFRLSVDANNVTPVLGSGLITFVLGATGRKALSYSELATELRAMARLVKTLQLPTTGDVELASREVLDRALQQLVHTGVLVRHEGGQEPLFAIAADATMAAAYYRNAMIHFLVIGAIAELALLKVAEQQSSTPREALHAEALHVRDVLKFEFFFQEKSRFLEELEHYLDVRAPIWLAEIAKGLGAIYALFWQLRPLLAPATLRPFLDSYLVVAETLTLHQKDADTDHKSILNACIDLGRQRLLQGRIGSEESVAKIYLENGMLLAGARNLLLQDDGGLQSRRTAFLAEITTLLRRTAFIATVAENRRLGIDTPGFNAA